MTNLNQTSIITNSIYENLLSKKVALVLGNNNETSTNSVDTNSKGLISSSIAFKLTMDDLKRVVKVPPAVDKVWKANITKPGYYSSSTYGNQKKENWPLYVLNGYLFMILSNHQNNRTDLAGENIPRHSLTDTTGNIAHTDDGQFSYVCIQKMPDRMSDYNRNYISISSPKEEMKRVHTYTTFGTEVSRKCGPGNQNVSGSCCIYNSAFEYDSITGTTSDIGDLYGCFETKCYKCIELSNKLGMEYIFHAWAGITATEEEKCLSGDSETSTECGPCACSIDLTSKSYYSDILNDKDISSSVSSWQNAKFEKVNQEELSGGIASAWVDLSGYTEEQRQISVAYKDISDLYVPILGSPTEGATIRINTVVDGTGNRMLQGFSFPENHGKGYVTAQINSTIWKNMFPSIDANKITIEMIPIGGFLSNLDKIFNCGMLISKVIKRDDITSTETIQDTFNQWSIQEIFDENEMNVFSNYTDAQSRVMNLSPVIEATKTGTITMTSNDLPAGDSRLSPTEENVKIPNTTFNDRVKKSAVSKTASNKTVIEIETPKPQNYVVGDEINIKSDTYTITSLTLPTTEAGTTIDPTKSIVHHIEKASINTNINPSLQQSWRFQVYFGSLG